MTPAVLVCWITEFVNFFSLRNFFLLSSSSSSWPASSCCLFGRKYLSMWSNENGWKQEKDFNQPKKNWIDPRPTDRPTDVDDKHKSHSDLLFFLLLINNVNNKIEQKVIWPNKKKYQVIWFVLNSMARFFIFFHEKIAKS